MILRWFILFSLVHKPTFPLHSIFYRAHAHTSPVLTTIRWGRYSYYLVCLTRKETDPEKLSDLSKVRELGSCKYLTFDTFDESRKKIFWCISVGSILDFSSFLLHSLLLFLKVTVPLEWWVTLGDSPYFHRCTFFFYLIFLLSFGRVLSTFVYFLLSGLHYSIKSEVKAKLLCRRSQW